MLTTLAQSDDPRRQVSALALIVVLLGVVGVCTLVMLAARRRARVRRTKRENTPGVPHPDAWAESGKRADPAISAFDDDEEPPPGASGPKTWS